MFGLGKKKNAEPPQNSALGGLLDNMMRDPDAYQDTFYTAFLTSNIFLIGEAGGAPGEKTLQGGESVRVMQWQGPDGNPFVPVFTSMDELKEAIKEMGEVPYISFSGYDALNLTQGHIPVAIDPSNEHCLYLAPPQIAQILSYFDSIRN
ncbi:MAG: SseB family protein [Alphaproteobacteria bacterium]